MGSKIGSFFRSLVGSQGAEAGAAPGAEAVEYEGFMIQPAARREGSQWLTVGVISKRFEEGVREQQFIRADFYSSKDEADACAVRKAKQIIDEQGDKLFK